MHITEILTICAVLDKYNLEQSHIEQLKQHSSLSIEKLRLKLEFGN